MGARITNRTTLTSSRLDKSRPPLQSLDLLSMGLEWSKGSIQGGGPGTLRLFGED